MFTVRCRIGDQVFFAGWDGENLTGPDWMLADATLAQDRHSTVTGPFWSVTGTEEGAWLYLNGEFDAEITEGEPPTFQTFGIPDDAVG